MCGIAGFIDHSPASSDILSAMSRRIAHRGPDGVGHQTFSSGPWAIALAHRRLSIIDLEGGKQPLSLIDDSASITFNGEIYNFLELKKTLTEKGVPFRTQSDTEVLLAHLMNRGVAGLGEVNGMFAFGLWNARTSQFVLARDRVGIKPLYYCELPGGGVAFGSELTAVMAHPKVRSSIDPGALASYFFSDYLSAPETLLRGVKKLEPGHYLTWHDGKLSSPTPYWNGVNLFDKTSSRSESELAEKLEFLLQQAVRRQLISDVPVGVLLSGGIDSSLIAAFVRREAGHPPKTFTIAFRDQDHDESRFARLVAKHLGTEHIEQVLDEGNVLDCLDAALDSLDEPMADPSLLPTFLLSRLASQHVKVALGGDGGDELFAGYPTYLAHRMASIYRKFPRAFRNRVLRTGIQKLPVRHTYQSLEWKLKRFTQRWDEEDSVRHFRWMSNTDIPQLRAFLPDWKNDPQILTRHRISQEGDALNRLLLLDFQTYLPGSVLTKVDRASMANGLEVRPPFLDNTLIDWAFSLPSHLKLKGKNTKFLLKKMAKPWLPELILKRRKKGFSIPLARWLSGPLHGRLSRVIEESPVWHRSPLSRLAFLSARDRHLGGREDFSKPLWALIVLDHWMKKEGVHDFSDI